MAKVKNLDELSAAEIEAIKIKIAAGLSTHSGVAPARSIGLLPISKYQGKLYEAHVLVSVLKKLKNEEGLDIEFINGKKVRFKHKGAWINRDYPYFKLTRFGKLFGELFVDQYFSSMSHKLRVSGSTFYPGDFHELDIALIKPSVAKFPSFEDVILGI